ncbi:hypothetical protein L596_016476 [Steinernema carpocapsae]|uniref:7TM GPCR serpentine receptor class x (Srx) domain-containing protein n=1 Tax=Steinernema carpocapsae TaxID=34508 RepID=A0A4U5NI27_STECR|nr:hypothetical protein L596_016476 [Steinernema carpocapsae]
MAAIALLECYQMSMLFVGGIMIASQHEFNEVVQKVIGAVIISTWLGLVLLRFFLALNRFFTLAEFDFLSSGSKKFYWCLLIISYAFSVSIFLVCVFHDTIFALNIHLGTWIYTGVSDLAQFEKFFVLILGVVGFLLYVLCCYCLFKKKQNLTSQSLTTEVQLLICFASSFIYESSLVIIYHVILKYLNINSSLLASIQAFWIFLPAFNGILLLLINRKFRNNFLIFSASDTKISVVRVTSPTCLQPSGVK